MCARLEDRQLILDELNDDNIHYFCTRIVIFDGPLSAQPSPLGPWINKQVTLKGVNNVHLCQHCTPVNIVIKRKSNILDEIASHISIQYFLRDD